MFENLTDKLDKAFQIIKGQGRITEINIAESLKEVRRALLNADVNYTIAKSFTNSVKEKALGKEVLTAVQPGELMVKIVRDELAELMGGESEEINIKENPSVILIAGLQGSGKTTFSAKLALFLKKKKNKNPILVAGDVYRPAAIDQLKVLGEQIQIDVFSNQESKDPILIASEAIQYAKKNKKDTIIIDTAGRLAIDEKMMKEVEAIKEKVKPQETLFVVDSMTGQDAVNTAKAFYERLDYEGVVLTKLDGDARGGAALSIKSVVTKPIKFISTGEKMDALDVFHPDRMANRILGMGDVVSLVEKAQQQFDEKEARKMQKKIAKNQFGFDDFLTQIQQIKKMGNLKDMMGMIPGIGKAIKDVDINDDSFKQIESIIHSMTPDERKNPSILDGSRRKRIAKGSGNSVQDINQLIKQFNSMGKLMKMMQGGGGKNIMNMFKGIQ